MASLVVAGSARHGLTTLFALPSRNSNERAAWLFLAVLFASSGCSGGPSGAGIGGDDASEPVCEEPIDVPADRKLSIRVENRRSDPIYFGGGCLNEYPSPLLVWLDSNAGDRVHPRPMCGSGCQPPGGCPPPVPICTFASTHRLDVGGDLTVEWDGRTRETVPLPSDCRAPDGRTACTRLVPSERGLYVARAVARTSLACRAGVACGCSSAKPCTCAATSGDDCGTEVEPAGDMLEALADVEWPEMTSVVVAFQ